MILRDIMCICVANMFARYVYILENNFLCKTIYFWVFAFTPNYISSFNF